MPRRFQFSLRALLVLVTAACASLGWHVRAANRQREAIKAIEEMGGNVFDYDPTEAGKIYVMFEQRAVQKADGTVVMPPGFTQGLFTFGPQLTLTDEGLKHVARLSNVDFVSIAGVPITDSGLKWLYRIQSLRELRLHHTKVTKAGVSAFQKALPNCQIEVWP